MKIAQIEPSWLDVLQNEFSLEYMAQLRSFFIEEKKQHPIYPPNKLIFNAFNLTPYNKVRVVILGQDPYHGVGQAHGWLSPYFKESNHLHLFSISIKNCKMNLATLYHLKVI